MMSTCKLSKHRSDVLFDPFIYKSTVGALQYLTLTCPDIAFLVNKACQFMAQPLDSHWYAVKRILCYLSGMTMLGLMLVLDATSQPFSLRAYGDSDWAIEPDDRRSTSNSCLFFGHKLVSWSSKKQALVARSNKEVEYHALTHTTSKSLWLESLLGKLHTPYLAPILFCDNFAIT